MESFRDLTNLIVAGEKSWSEYGDVKASYYDDLILFNYTTRAQIEGRWNWFERVSRGLVMEAETGKIVALPMPKFHNWLEGGRRSSRGSYMVDITEKLDGSLGIMFYHNGKWRIVTRGSFFSDQALWANGFLHTHFSSILDQIPQQLTLMFEIIYPDNRIVCNYGEKEDLVLIAVRNRDTLMDYFFYPTVYNLAATCEFNTPRTYQFNSISDIIALTGDMDASQEGFVVRFSDGQRFKFKGDDYLYLHRLVSHLSFGHVLELMRNGIDPLDSLPQYLHSMVREWQLEIQRIVDLNRIRVERAFELAPKDDRKTFALWVKQHYPDLASCLFNKLDGKSYEDLLYKRILKR